MKSILLAFLSVVLLPAAIAADSVYLVQSTPADGSLIITRPSEFVFEFSEPVRFNKLLLSREGERGSKSISGLPQQDAKTHTIPAPALSEGNYILEWKVFTHESTLASGRIRFMIAAPSS